MRLLCGSGWILRFGRRARRETSTAACLGDDGCPLATVASMGTPKGSGAALILQDPEKTSRKSKVSSILGVVGVILITIACLMSVVDPIDIIANQMLSLREGSYAFGLWRKPPVTIYLRVYVFNVTNSEAFLQGEERMHLQELGPYVYREELQNSNPVFGLGNDDSITFEPRRTVHWEADMSRGSLQDKIIVPNLPLVALATLLHKSSRWTNMAFSSLTNYLSTKPFLQITVEEYFWGHEEPLLSLASTFVPSWITFSSLGLLDRLYAMDAHNITIKDGRIDPKNRYLIEKVNGVASLGRWAWKDPPEPDEVELHEACRMRDTVAGTYEGILFPRHINKNTSIRVFRDAFCRPMILEHQEDIIVDNNIPAYRFRPPKDFLNNRDPENDCLCVKNEEKCLPAGLSDMSPCYFGIPIVVSYPHLYLADPKLREDVIGMSPDEEKHESFVDIQPDAGVPLEGHSRIQLNILAKDTSRVRRAAPFKNLVIPIVWTDMSLDRLPDSIMSVVHLLVVIAPIIQTCATIGLSCLGAAMIFVCIFLQCFSWLNERTSTNCINAAKEKWFPLGIIPSLDTNRQYVPVRVTEDMSNQKGLQKKLGQYMTAGYIHHNTDHLSGYPLLEQNVPMHMTKTDV